MATVLQAPRLPVSIGINLQSDPLARLRKEYYDILDEVRSKRKQELSELLKGEVTQEAGYEPGTMPSEWKPVQTDGQWEMQPVGYKEGTLTPEVRGQPITEEEQIAYNTESRRLVEALGAKYPREIRVDPWTMYPKEESLGRLATEQEIKKQAKVTGLVPWRAFDKKTDEPIPGKIIRSRSKPQDTKNYYWDLEKGVETYYGARAGREAKEITSETNLQRLLTNYLDDPTKENEIALSSAYKAKGYTLVKPETTVYDRIKRFFGADIPILVARDKQGNYIGIDEMGNETILKRPKKAKSKDKYTVGAVYKDAQGNKAKYLGNGKWQRMK